MLSAIFYVLRSGIAWRDLPASFGPWSSVYSRWRRWTATGLWNRMLRLVARRARGTTRFVDSTHVKVHQDGANPERAWEAQGVGRTKGGLDTKLTALVDCYGRLVAITLHPGSRNDVRAVHALLPLRPGQTLVADKVFDADNLRETVAAAGGFTCIPRRDKCGLRPFRRRLATRYDRLGSCFLAFVLFAAVLDWIKN